jgi:hypothetical protein
MRENSKSEIRDSKQAQRKEIRNPKRVPVRHERLVLRVSDLFRISDFDIRASLPVVLTGVGILLAGCAVKPERLPVCPGKPTTAAALQTLAARARDAVPLRANGQGRLTYHVPDKERPERHNLPMQMWFNPPADVYVQGSVGVDVRAVIIGSNEQEFWLALRPKEMSSYYAGRWQDVRDFEGLMMSPRVVLEAFGIVAGPDGEPDAALWSLQNKGPYDILTRRDEAGRPVKRVYVYACDYLVRKIEYYDPAGKIVAVATLGDYKPVEGFLVPTRIDVVATGRDGRKDTMEIELSSLKLMKFNEQQLQRLFVPPDTDKFEHIYRYEEGRWVPQR